MEIITETTEITIMNQIMTGKEPGVAARLAGKRKPRGFLPRVGELGLMAFSLSWRLR